MYLRHIVFIRHDKVIIFVVQPQTLLKEYLSQYAIHRYRRNQYINYILAIRSRFNCLKSTARKDLRFSQFVGICTMYYTEAIRCWVYFVQL